MRVPKARNLIDRKPSTKKATTLALVSLSSAASPPITTKRTLVPTASHDPLALAPSLSGLSEELIEHIASFLAPRDLASFLGTSKSLSSSFWATREGEAEPLAVRLMQLSLRRQLDEILNDVFSRKEDRPSFNLDDLFPEEEREEDFDEDWRPQVNLSGSCTFQAGSCLS